MPRPSAPSTRTQSSSVEDLKAQLEALLDEQVLAEGLVERLRTGRKEKLLSLPDDEMQVYEQEIAAAQRKFDRASAQIELAQRAYNEALERETEAPRVEAYNRTLRRSLAVRKRLETEYPELAAGLASLLKELAACEAEVTRANADLPRGAKPIDSPEVGVRTRPYQARQLVSERVVERWVAAANSKWQRDETGRFVHIPIIPDENVNSLRRAGHDVQRRKLYERTYRLSQPAVTPESLTKTVRLPGLKAGDEGYGTDRPDFLVGQQTEVVFDVIEAAVSVPEPA